MTYDFPGYDEAQFDPDELEGVLSYLREWAYGHPRSERPFLIEMGRTLTPVEFFYEVEKRTEFGLGFLQFLFAQARRAEERPVDAVARAIKANG
ncbi:hypothetical protein [Gloeobacter morelensis]|uniref:Uncharacterized protein n=1 Tax=Gloeobacter morelensis MG652769 TaxID=2781736 RepID=A0ABY3PQE3_9CYAN|nr:hypothetical protein [Gloeobacter morelensis]UFP95933.1 hypothetical protein ISF26_06855 [Gloeobacter morelensis MG652769]